MPHFRAKLTKPIQVKLNSNIAYTSVQHLGSKLYRYCTIWLQHYIFKRAKPWLVFYIYVKEKYSPIKQINSTYKNICGQIEPHLETAEHVGSAVTGARRNFPILECNGIDQNRVYFIFHKRKRYIKNSFLQFHLCTLPIAGQPVSSL